MEPGERAIGELHKIWIDAVNSANIERLLVLMTDDAVFLNPGQAPLGRDGFPDVFTAAHRKYRIHCNSVLEEVLVAGEFAYTLCQDSLSLAPRAGEQTTELAGHRITIYRKQPDGRWLLARDINTLFPLES